MGPVFSQNNRYYLEAYKRWVFRGFVLSWNWGFFFFGFLWMFFWRIPYICIGFYFFSVTVLFLFSCDYFGLLGGAFVTAFVRFLMLPWVANNFLFLRVSRMLKRGECFIFSHSDEWRKARRKFIRMWKG